MRPTSGSSRTAAAPRFEELDLVDDAVDAGPYSLAILRPRNAEALLDEEAFEREEFLPYWAELWPSGLALARAVAARDVRGLRVLELGCGLALPSLVAARGGADVLAADWSPDAVALARVNAERNGTGIEVVRCSWAEPAPLVARAPFDLVLAADVLYERRDAQPLLALLPQLAPEVLLADPGRPHTGEFLERAAAEWTVETAPAPEGARVALHTLRRPT